MAKIYLVTKKEFDSMSEEKQIAYLAKVGAFMTANAGVFASVTHNGVAISAAGVSLGTKHGARGLTAGGQGIYETQLDACKVIMDLTYDEVDTISAGSKEVIEQACMNATSDNTASIGKPLRGVGTVYAFTGTPHELKIKWNGEKLSIGGIVITTTSDTVVVEVSGDSQLKITVGEVIIFVDITTKHFTVIKNLLGASLVHSFLALFNSNGVSPLVTVAPHIVPNV